MNFGMTSSSIVGMGDSVDGFGPDSSMDLEADSAVVADDKTLLSSDSSENLPGKEKRVVKKATVEANGVPHSGGVQDAAVGKHGASTAHKGHRRRRHARGRVLLKKGIC